MKRDAALPILACFTVAACAVMMALHYRDTHPPGALAFDAPASSSPWLVNGEKRTWELDTANPCTDDNPSRPIAVGWHYLPLCGQPAVIVLAVQAGICQVMDSGKFGQVGLMCKEGIP